MIWRGDEAINCLAADSQQHDSAASSHWQKYHAKFSFDGAEFSGVQGFGGTARQRNFLSSLVHRLLQIPFRLLAKRMLEFKKLDALAHTITKVQNRAYNLDVLRQAISLSFLSQHADCKFTSNSNICVIGDGFASMTSLLIGGNYASKVILINLTKTLLVDLWYLRQWLGEQRFNKQVALVDSSEGLAQAQSDPNVRVISIQAHNHHLLQNCPIDAAINIASMQEMNPPIIAAYFEDLRKAATVRNETLLFYCCNREEKQLPDGTIVKITEYPWHADDIIEIDALCPWHQTYYSSRPPFYHPYEGPVRHRLAKFQPINRMNPS